MKLMIKFLGDEEYLKDFFDETEIIKALTSVHEFTYDDSTLLSHLIYFMMIESKFYSNDFVEQDIEDFYCRFTYKYRGVFTRFPKENIPLHLMIRIVAGSGILEVSVEISLSGGLGIDRFENLFFAIYTNEKNLQFEPHVHVYNGSDRVNGIRVSLENFEVKIVKNCNIKSKDINKAIHRIKKNQAYYISEYHRIVDLSVIDTRLDVVDIEEMARD